MALHIQEARAWCAQPHLMAHIRKEKLKRK